MSSPPISPPRKPLSLRAVSKRLSDGDSPQEILDDVMDSIVQDEPSDPLMAVECIILLATQGALAATDRPGCALERLIATHTTSMPPMVMDLVRRLAPDSRQLPFHVMAKHFPMVQSKGSLEDPVIQASLRARDSMGRTTSHWLWDDAGFIAREKEPSKSQPARPTDVAERERKMLLTHSSLAWTIQTQLQAVGVGLALPDAQGHTALELCVKRVDTHQVVLLPGLDVCKQVMAYRNQRAMATKTPPTDASKLGPRF